MQKILIGLVFVALASSAVLYHRVEKLSESVKANTTPVESFAQKVCRTELPRLGTNASAELVEACSAIR